MISTKNLKMVRLFFNLLVVQITPSNWITSYILPPLVDDKPDVVIIHVGTTISWPMQITKKLHVIQLKLAYDKNYGVDDSLKKINWCLGTVSKIKGYFVT